MHRAIENVQGHNSILTPEPPKMCLSSEELGGHNFSEGFTDQRQGQECSVSQLAGRPLQGARTAHTLATVKYKSGKKKHFHKHVKFTVL